MAQSSAGSQAPIPPARKDDSEDVAWALSTAEAMYARGDRGDALKWLRRAAESASESEADDRALELAKAAAELAATLGPTPSAPPPPPPPPRASHAPPAPSVVPAPPRAPVTPSQIPPAPITAPLLPTAAARPAGAPLPPRSVPPAPPTPKPPTRQGGGLAPTASRVEARRAARRSRPDIEISRPPDESTQTMQDMALPLAQPKRRGRASRPSPDEVTPGPPRVAFPAQGPATAPLPVPAGARTEDIDAWPTQTTAPKPEDSTDDLPDEKTRIGVPAYEAKAKMATEAQSTPALEETPLRASQAVRVVVWRTPDGVRVAPHGTHVAAITVDAVLVALEPSADLAAWLSRK